MSQTTKTILVSAFVGLIAAFIGAKVFISDAKSTDKVEIAQNSGEITKLRCGYGTWPPYLVKDPNTGELSGLSYDVIEKLSEAMNIEFEWVEEVGFGDFLEGFTTNRYDMMCVSIWPEPERIKRSVVTIPLYYSVLFAYVRADDRRFDGDLSKINSLDIKTIHIEGDMTQEIANIDFPNSTKFALPQMSDHSQMFISLTTGKGDVLFVDEGIVKDFEKTNPGKVRKVLDVDPIRLFPEPLSLSHKIGHLKPAFDAAIHTMIANGDMKRILDKYDVSTYAQKIELDIE